MADRRYWCGRFGAQEVTYRLHPTTPEFTRPLCPVCAESATHAAQERLERLSGRNPRAEAFHRGAESI